MDKVNYALVGFGGIAKTHAIGTYIGNMNYDLPFNLNLKTIVTKVPIKACPSGAINTTELKEALEDPEIHFIDICTPNDSHEAIVLKALEYGKAVYCEKPLSSSYDEALNMTLAVKENKAFNAVALMYRFMPAVRLIKEVIEEKSIGDIIDFKINLYHKGYLNQNKKATWRTTKSSGGGALLDLGIHLIDVVSFTLGNIIAVEGNTRIFFKDKTDVDEIGNLKLVTEKATGNLEVSRIYADMEENTCFHIHGTKGSIKMNSNKPYTIDIYDYDKNIITVLSAKERPHILENYPSERNSFGFHVDCHTSSIINFAKEIYYKERNLITPTFEDALKAQKVIKMAYENDGKTIEI